MPISRRSALVSVAGLPAAGLARPVWAEASSDVAAVVPFPLSQVRLNPSPFLTSIEAN